MGKLTSTQQEPTGESLWWSDSSRCNRRPAEGPNASLRASVSTSPLNPLLVRMWTRSCSMPSWTLAAASRTLAQSGRSPDPASSSSNSFALASAGPETARELCQLDAAAEGEAIAYHTRLPGPWALSLSLSLSFLSCHVRHSGEDLRPSR